MELKDIATIKIGLTQADFWIIRRGDIKQVGKPSRNFNPESIGIKVEKNEIVNPDFLFYALLNLYNQGFWQSKACGSLSLVNIKIEDVKKIRLGGGG